MPPSATISKHHPTAIPPLPPLSGGSGGSARPAIVPQFGDGGAVTSRQGSAGSHPAQISPNKHHVALGGTHVGHSSIGASLTDVHAQRVVAVLNEVLSKVDIAMTLPPVVDRRAQNMLGSDLASEIEKYNQLKRQVNYTGAGTAPESAITDLQDSIRNVCRILLHDPDKRQQLSIYNAHDANQSNVRQSILAVDLPSEDDEGNASNQTSSTMQSEMEVLKQLLASCKLLTVDKLTRSAQDEENKKLELQRVVEREKRIRDEVEHVRAQLEKAKKERLAEINVKNDLIRKLKDELKDIKQTAEDVARRLEMRTKSKEESDSASYSEREAALQTEIKQLQAQLALQVAAHREEEINLRKRRFKVESEVDAWISKYDQDMEEKQAELDDLSAIYAEEKAQLDDLQAKYDDLNKEYHKILDERKWHEVVKAKLEAERLLRIKCVTQIQAAWRGYKVRKELREANDKKRKGSKSAKGKKKKK